MPSPVAVATLLRIANGSSRRSEEGQDLLEYGLLAALIAIVAIGAVSARRTNDLHRVLEEHRSSF